MPDAAPAPRPVRVAIANDYEIVVSGVAAVLAPYADRVVVVELDARKPVLSDVDVVLYDTFAQVQGDSLDLHQLTDHSGARVLVFSWNTDVDLVNRTFDSRVAGYLSKGVSALELVEALERVARGERVEPQPGASSDTFGRWPGQEAGLTPREAEVLALICQGLTNQDIAERAFIGMNTVKTHIRKVYRTIGVVSRSQAILWGLSHGFEPDASRRLLD